MARRILYVVVVVALTVLPFLSACQTSTPKPASDSAGQTQPTQPAAPKEPFKVGLTGALSGSGGVSYLPMADGLRIYISKVNDEGGIDGRKIELIMDDDAGEPTRAGANATKLAGQGVSLVVANTLAANYDAVYGATSKANIPMFLTGSGYQRTYQPADPLVFGNLGGWSNNTVDMPPLYMKVIDDFNKAKGGGGKVKLGLGGHDSPVIRFLFDNYIVKSVQDQGFDLAPVEYIPLNTTDFTPVASRLKDAGVNYWFYYGAGDLGVQTDAALRRLGWKGTYVHLGMTVAVELSGEKIKNANTLVLVNYVPLSVNIPEHQALKSAASKYGVSNLNSGLIHGWQAGRAVVDMLKKTGYPTSTDKMLGVLKDYSLPGDAMMPVGITYKGDDHSGWAHIAGWTWDAQKNNWTQATDWYKGSSDGKTMQKVTR